MKRYYSKLLLFGEYIIIKGASGLAITYEKYSGSWSFEQTVSESNEWLRQWLGYLKEAELPAELGITLDLARFENEINRGLFFDSNIPLGYGVGSSGALVAAFFERYVTNFDIEKTNIFLLKKVFVWLEAFFHGGGSGIDPLICYLEEPLILKPSGKMEIGGLPNFPKFSNSACFLLNTYIRRSTEPLVAIFHKECLSVVYENKCKEELAVFTNKAVSALFEQDNKTLFQQVQLISDFQQKYFGAMIPSAFQKIWSDGLETGIYTLKLCGAGGGGFILGFTEDWAKTQQKLAEYDLEVVFYL